MLTTDQTLLADRLRLAVGRLARRLRQKSLGEITPSQLSILASLNRCGEMTMSELADVEGVSRPSVTGITNRLVNNGLVEQQPHNHDGRSSVVGLTSKGRSVLKQGREKRTAYLRDQLGHLDDGQIEILTQAVDILDGMVDEQ